MQSLTLTPISISRFSPIHSNICLNDEQTTTEMDEFSDKTTLNKLRIIA